jgi:diaphanous 1
VHRNRHKAIDKLRFLAIMLSRFKMTPLEISQALLSFDDKLSIDDLKAISKQLPSPEEVRYH